MAKHLRYTRAAKADLRRIARYTLEHFNAEQLARYLAELERVCEHIAAFPDVGLEYAPRPGYLYFARPKGSVIYYRVQPSGQVEIVWILHKRMLAAKRLKRR